MTLGSKWMGAAIMLLIVSTALASFVPATLAASPGKHASRHERQSSPRCKQRNKATGTIKYSDDQFPDTLNPEQATLAVDFETLDGMFDSLFIYNNKAKFVPQMATNIPTIKNHEILDGGRTYIIHLKPGLRWSNNAIITSKDIVFGWHIGMAKASGPYCLHACDVITHIDTPNRYTAVFHLSRPSAPFLANDLPPIWPTRWLHAWNNNDAHAAAIKLYNDTSFNFENSTYPTDGPYQVTSYLSNDHITLAPMKYYDDENCGGYVKNLRFVFYSTPQAMSIAAASHATDVTQGYTADSVRQLATNAPGKYKLHVDPGFFVEHLEFNQDATYKKKANPLHSPAVRVALALALDKAHLIRSALFLQPSQVKSFDAWTFLFNTPNLAQIYADRKLQGQWDPIQHKFLASTGYGTALADAKMLLSHTRWRRGFTLDWFTTAIPARVASEKIAAADWARLGVKVNFHTTPSSNLFGTAQQAGILGTGGFQVSEFAYALNTPDPDGWKYNFQSKYIDRRATGHTVFNSNNAGVVDSYLNREFNIGNSAMNSSVRARAYNGIQVEVNKLADWIPLYYRPNIVTNDSHVKNFSNNPTLAGPEWNIYNWHDQS